MKVVSLWSAGKDSCFACYKAKQEGHEITALVNFTDTSCNGSVSHGLSSEIIRMQAELTGIPLLQKPMPQKGYTEEFKAFIEKLKIEKAVKGIVFGDIYLQEHRDWIDKVCGELKVEAILPAWTTDTLKLVQEIIGAGFKSIIVSARKGILGQEWLGREINHETIEELKSRPGFDLCGEKGEFHTFTYAGPLFKKPVNFSFGEKTSNDKYYFLEILPK